MSNKFLKTVRGIGYIGEGKYLVSIKRKHTKIYITWRGLLERCYSESYHIKKPTYKDCSVHPDWHNFQVFAEWFEKNYVEGFELDKDILIKGNKIYSPETCCFIPPEVNTLFTKSNKARGEYPIGVSFVKSIKKFISQLSIENRQINLGYFDTPEEAFYAYKIGKEDYIKLVGDKYKSRITEACYQALTKYKVEITD
jgi:hypothetical protein